MKIILVALMFSAGCCTSIFAADRPGAAQVQQEKKVANVEAAASTGPASATTKVEPEHKNGGKLQDAKSETNPAPGASTSSAVASPQSPPSNLSFWITIVVVVTAGVVNFSLSSRAIQNQTREATKSRQADHQNKVSEYRHSWLQELRNTASDLIKVIHEGQAALMRSNLERDYRDSARQSRDLPAAEKHQQAMSLNYAAEGAARSEIYKYASKIKLLFKPDDTQATKLFHLLNQVIERIGDPKVRRLDDEIIEAIVAELQVILKSEWEITKARMVVGDAEEVSLQSAR